MPSIFKLTAILLLFFVCCCNHSSDENADAGASDFEDSGQTYDCSGVIHFEDPNLEKIVREEIQKPEGDILKEDVDDVKHLTGNSLGIISLQGIQCFSSLETLDLMDNNISSITPLGELINLRVIKLNYNDIVSVSSLADIESLEHISLINNNVGNIISLSKLIKLKEIYFSNNNIADISAIENLSDLEYVNFVDNKILNLPSLDKLINILEINLAGNRISSLDAFSDLSSSNYDRYFGLYSNNVSDLKPLADNINGINEGNTLNLGDNPINCNKQKDNIDALKRRLVNIITDCN